MTYRAHFFSITATDPGHCSNPGRLARAQEILLRINRNITAARVALGLVK